MALKKALAALAAIAVFGLTAVNVAVAGQPVDWQMGFQPAASPVMERMIDFHNLLLVIIFSVAAFVMVLLLIIIVRFNAKANPVPSKTTHNTLLEVIWTIVPIMILVVIAIPSFKLLFFYDTVPDSAMTIKAVGHQWYWAYEYPDDGDFGFDALMVEDGDLADGEPRLLATDEKIVLPVDTDIRVLLTAEDVIHAWAVPALGVKMDAVPGRLSETWLRITKEGKYYGQCSELCGVNHGFMPIEIHAVSKAAYAAWVVEAREEYARVDIRGIQIASASALAAR
jgi:cytochrome c oxidase subunit 2